MAGLIEIDDEGWSVSSWLFRWVVTRVADNARVDRLVEMKLREIVDANLGGLSLNEVDDLDRLIILNWLADHLVGDAEKHLPMDMVQRDQALRYLEELAQVARDSRGEENSG